MTSAKKARDKKPTYEELKAFFAERAKTMRQHGKLGKTCENEADDYKRLYNNYLSIKTRANRKKIEKAQDEAWSWWKQKDEDEYGIRPVDERRYKLCFTSYYKGLPIELSYVKRMTGCTLYQIWILQQRTGFIPSPPVTKKDALADQKRIEREGITALIDG